MSEPATPGTGLTSDEARRRLAQSGANATAVREPPLWRRTLAKLWAPVPWMLEAAILLQFMMRQYLEAAVIAVLVLFNAALGVLHESRADATLAALKSRLALSARVRRDGAWTTLPVEQLVYGDVVKLTLGCIVPADVRLIEGDVLLDQSMLTGESLPVEGAQGTVTYAGALVRRGEAVAEIIATGPRTRFGKTAELVSLARTPSSQERAVLQIVRDLAVFSASMVLLQLLYATAHHMAATQTIPLVLTAVLAAIPVALPATFTLASAVGARDLASHGVLPTRLSAIDEAATMDVLCSDKTGTLTQNALTVTAVRPEPGYDAAHVLALASLASEQTGTDPVDAAIRTAAGSEPAAALPELVRFVPFDPTLKLSQAEARDSTGAGIRIVKGALARIAEVVPPPVGATATAAALAKQGNRVIAVAVEAPSREWVGLIALSDPPRPDAGPLIAELGSLGVRTVMVTGDAEATASVVARAVGLAGSVCPAARLPDRPEPQDIAVFAGVYPEQKFHIVRAFQAAGHTVGMCGDGANDAPALRQAQIGIAVSTATDVAKSAAGIVLTRPGLAGIVDAVRAGRVAYQRILTYTLRSVTTKIQQMLFLTVGLVVTGRAILTPMLMVIVMIGGDFLAMSATTDHVRTSAAPNAWRIGRVTLLAIVLGLSTLVFCTAALWTAFARLGLSAHHGLRTLAALALVFSSQAAFYVVRDRRRLWSSRPSGWVFASSALNIAIFALLAGRGWLMHALPWPLIGLLLAATVPFAFALDEVKRLVLDRMRLD